MVCTHNLFRICVPSLSLKQTIFYRKPDSHYLFYYGTIALEVVNDLGEPWQATMQFPIKFNEAHETRIHLLQMALTAFVIVFSIVRMTIYDPPPSRINVVPITMGFKTLFLIGYQLLTAHVRKWQKWASTKANAVINCLECVFWLAVIVCAGKALKGSYGVAAAMSALAMIFSIILM